MFKKTFRASVLNDFFLFFLITSRPRSYTTEEISAKRVVIALSDVTHGGSQFDATRIDNYST